MFINLINYARLNKIRNDRNKNLVVYFWVKMYDRKNVPRVATSLIDRMNSVT